MQDLKIIVKEIKGYCDTIQEGDYFIVRGGKISIPEGHFCYWMEGTWLVECPDPNGQVIMEMVPIDPE